MKCKKRQNEAEMLCKELKALISTTPPPDLSGMVELASLNTDGVCRIGGSYIVTPNETTELIDIEFDDTTIITLCSINGNCTVDVIPSNFINLK